MIPGLKEEAAVAQSRLTVAFLGDWKKIQRNHQIIKYSQTVAKRDGKLRGLKEEAGLPGKGSSAFLFKVN